MWENLLTRISVADKTLNRGISRATDNVNIVSRVRSELALVDNADEENLFIETPLYTFTLPDFSQYPGILKMKLYIVGLHVNFVMLGVLQTISGNFLKKTSYLCQHKHR